MLAGALASDPRFAASPIEFANFAQMACELCALRTRLAMAPGDPEVLHVAGGVHASAEPLATLRAGFDLVAIGDGEHTIRAL